MLNITIDTCVWLELLKVDFKNEDNYLEELCFWIENKHIKHIVPTNIIDEWNRHKINYQNEITNYFKRNEQENINPFKHNSEMSSTYNSVEIERIVQKRIERIDLIFSSYSEKAPFNDAILKDAAERNLKTLAPNHKKDSFRDTVNILSLLQHIKSNGYTETIFTTLNYKDFAIDGSKRYDLHENLTSDFDSAKLSYIYFDEQKQFGARLFNKLRGVLPSYQDYLKDKKAKEEAKRLAELKVAPLSSAISNPDDDYLENIKYIDDILKKKKRTSVDEEIIKMIITRHDSYKQYFLTNVGNNGLV
jgi:hypothetical protein